MVSGTQTVRARQLTHHRLFAELLNEKRQQELVKRARVLLLVLQQTVKYANV
jgi:hypothetical protein